MKTIKASIDSIPIILNVPQTEEEYREGARFFGGNLPLDEGILFNFSSNPSQIILENGEVSQDLTLLFFINLFKTGIVAEVGQLKMLDTTPIQSKGVYSCVIELRKDFCKAYNIKVGSILHLKEDLR